MIYRNEVILRKDRPKDESDGSQWFHNSLHEIGNVKIKGNCMDTAMLHNGFKVEKQNGFRCMYTNADTLTKN